MIMHIIIHGKNALTKSVFYVFFFVSKFFKIYFLNHLDDKNKLDFRYLIFSRFYLFYYLNLSLKSNSN